MMSVEDGYSAAAQTVVSKELPCDGRMVSFVRITKNSLWLLNLVEEKGYGRAAYVGLVP